MKAAHTALVVEGGRDEADWADLEEKAGAVTRAGCHCKTPLTRPASGHIQGTRSWKTPRSNENR